MTISTITCHRVYNHGASLQEYALAKYLQSCGHDVQIIDYTPRRGGFNGRAIFNKPILRQLYNVAKWKSNRRFKKRERAFDEFEKRFIAPMMSTQNYSSWEELRDARLQADLFIAGSDQIWNTRFANGTDPAFYLDFGNESARRISYAASFATKELREGTEDFVKSHLKNLDAISVREKSGLNLLRSLGFSGEMVCDPVFLLNRKEWDEVTVPMFDDKGYIVVYDMNESGEIEKVVRRIAKAAGLKIYSIGATPLKYADKNFYASGPDMFVSLIRNAEYVVSNSFHGTVFAMIYHIPFFVVNRRDGLNDRMADLLSRHGVMSRLVSSETPTESLLEAVDFSKLDESLEKEISFSKRWLHSAIGI